MPPSLELPTVPNGLTPESEADSGSELPIGAWPSIERLRNVQAGRQTKGLAENAEGIRHGNVTVTGNRPREHVRDSLLAGTQVGHTQYLLKHQQGIRSRNASILVDVTVGMTGLPGV